jgi:hypothetical protein
MSVVRRVRKCKCEKCRVCIRRRYYERHTEEIKAKSARERLAQRMRSASVSDEELDRRALVMLERDNHAR